MGRGGEGGEEGEGGGQEGERREGKNVSATTETRTHSYPLCRDRDPTC